MSIASEDIVRIASYMTIIHHTRGRLRVRVSPKIQGESKNISLEDIESLPSKIKGIESLKINRLMGSITISYDSAIFPRELWEDLIAGNNIEGITQRVNRLYKEVL
jgi:hypothetical protein